MATKHTPGPWEAKEHTHNIGRDLAGRHSIRAQARIPEVEKMLPGYANDLIAILPANSAYNAQLIAAAPDMLEALAMVRRELAFKPDVRLTDEGSQQIIAAIEKATGTSQ